MAQPKTSSHQDFFLPAEWSSHEATWIAWPHAKRDWPGKITPILWVYAEIVRYLSQGEKVRIIVASEKQQKRALYCLKAVSLNLHNIEFYIQKTDRGWMRDSGPCFVRNDQEAAVAAFRFNAWAKYSNYQEDQKVPEMVFTRCKLKHFVVRHKDKQVCLEGGSIDINGRGTLITTEECLMDPLIQVRNPGFSKSDYEHVFREYLGVTNVLWLGLGIAGDDTHGHVDDLCRFVNEDTLVIVQETNEKDQNYIRLQENKERVQDFRLENGKKVNVVFLPMPAPLFFKGVRLPASYANFYISNTHVLVPTFNDPKDRIALGILSELFPQRCVVGIHAVDLVWGLGTIHCLTREQPLL
ncbi:MAG: agmatine deiminase family protein [Parachlamydiales bacterium]|nr:agmatine deiminase family protein [Parachlamydiales bacterium]